MHSGKNWPKYLQKKEAFGIFRSLKSLIPSLQSSHQSQWYDHDFSCLNSDRFWRIFEGEYYTLANWDMILKAIFFFLLLAGFDSLHRYAKEEEPRLSNLCDLLLED